jgi:hypothetical protein
LIEILAQIRAPKPRQFVAGIVLFDDVVVEAAPIVHYMKRGKWTRARVREWCCEKGWEISVVHQLRRPEP